MNVLRPRASRFAPIFVLAVFCLLGASVPSAPAASLPAEALAPLAGEWEGTLSYRDYRSDQLVSIGVSLSNSIEADYGVIRTELAFTDPGRIVRQLQLAALSSDGREWATLSVGAGAFEENRLSVESFEADAAGWRLVLVGEGRDDDRAADFRITQRLDGDRFTSRKEVRIQGDPGADWRFRNEVEVTRSTPSIESLLGTWKVDLRPTPDAAEYYQSFVVRRAPGEAAGDSAPSDGLIGEFYGTQVENFRVNTDWGYVSFAFTTNDGSGVYHTSGRVDGDRIEGRTHSLGRGFLAEWTATRE